MNDRAARGWQWAVRQAVATAVGCAAGATRRAAPARAPLLLAAAVAAALGCHDGSERPAHLVVGTYWTGSAAQALQRELVGIARGTGPVVVAVRTFTRGALLDDLERSQPGEGYEPLDLAIVPHDWLAALIAHDAVSELPPDRVDVLRQELVAQSLQAVTSNRRVFGYPISAKVLALIYDPSVFGHPPDSIAGLLTAPLPTGVLPLALDLRDPEVLAPLITSLRETPGEAGRWPAGAAVADVLRRLAPAWDSAAGWRACRGRDLESLQLQLFAEGRLASFVASPWLLAALERCGRPFAVMPIPPLSPRGAPTRALVGYECVVVARGSQWGDLAIRVGARLLDATVNERLNRATGHLPVLLRAYEAMQLTQPGGFGFLRAVEQGQFVPASERRESEFRALAAGLARFTEPEQPPAIDRLGATLGEKHP